MEPSSESWITRIIWFSGRASESAITEMMTSVALPKVAFSNPPTAVQRTSG